MSQWSRFLGLGVRLRSLDFTQAWWVSTENLEQGSDRWNLCIEGLWLTMVHLMLCFCLFFFFNLPCCESNTYYVETALWALIFSWASRIQYGLLPWSWAVAATSQPSGRHTTDSDTYNHSVQTLILFFTFSTVANQLHEIFNTLL